MEQYRNEEDIQDLGEHLLVTSIDVSSDFDATEHDFLYKYLEKTGIPKDVIKALRFNYETITASIKNGYKECFKFTSGIPQGSALRGLIFTIMLSPIIRRIRKNSKIIALNKLDGGVHRVQIRNEFIELTNNMNNHFRK